MREQNMTIQSVVLSGLGVILRDPIPWGPITTPRVTMYIGVNLRCFMRQIPSCYVGINRRGCDRYFGQDHQLNHDQDINVFIAHSPLDQ